MISLPKRYFQKKIKDIKTNEKNAFRSLNHAEPILKKIKKIDVGGNFLPGSKQ